MTPDVLGWLIAAMAALHHDGYTDPDLTMHLILSGIIAESQLDPYAERYGIWPDVSFALSQRQVALHWAGNGQNTPENIAVVRAAAFADPVRDLYEMGKWLLGNIHQVRASIKRGGDLQPVDGDMGLAVLTTYNWGSYPVRNSVYWTEYTANVIRYKHAMFQARQILEKPK